MKQQKSNLWPWIALISTLIAVGTHAYLTHEFYLLKLGLAAEKSLCNINQTFNCDAVAMSPFAQIFSIPVALWGLAANAMAALLISGSMLNLGEEKSYSPYPKLTILISFLLVIASVVMGAISTFQLQTYCLFCLATYVLSILTFSAVILWQKSHLQSLTHELLQIPTRSPKLLGFFIAIPVFAFLGNNMILKSYGAGQLDIMMQEIVNNWNSNPKVDFNLDLGVSRASSANDPKKVTIVEFVDFLCPHCKASIPTVKTFVDTRPETKLVVKLFVLDGTCNSEMTQKGDGVRCQLASAFLCSEKIGQKGWSTLEWIFERQHLFNSAQIQDQIKELSSYLQISNEELTTCMSKQETFDQIQAMGAEGKKGELAGTPALYFNGKRMDGGHAIPFLEAVLDAAKNQK